MLKVTRLTFLHSAIESHRTIFSPELSNRYGLNFRANDPPLLIGEMQFKNQQMDASGLARVVKLGGWYHTGKFDDKR